MPDYATVSRKVAGSSADCSLGVMNYSGAGVPKDFVSAYMWENLAASPDSAGEKNHPGVMNYGGAGVPKDFVAAYMWENLAAAPGSAEAVKWYRRAAEQGNAAAQFNLGWMYDDGRGVPEDHAEAVKWYRRAAKQGNAPAQHNLGAMYERGQGVREDHAEALKWYRRAAEQGNASSQFNLGLMYAKGRGVSGDFVAAYMWLDLAAAQGVEVAVTNRDIIGGRMTPAQLAVARKMARDWSGKFQSREKA